MSACPDCDFQKSKGVEPLCLVGQPGCRFHVEAYCRECRAKARKMARTSNSPIKVTANPKVRYARRPEADESRQLVLGGGAQ